MSSHTLDGLASGLLTPLLSSFGVTMLTIFHQVSFLILCNGFVPIRVFIFQRRTLDRYDVPNCLVVF